jgi:hypothetical protein
MAPNNIWADKMQKRTIYQQDNAEFDLKGEIGDVTIGNQAFGNATNCITSDGIMDCLFLFY